MIKSRSKVFLHAEVARAEPGGGVFDDAKAGRPIELRLNRLERAAARHGRIDQRFDKAMWVSFDSADSALLGACEMQQRCVVLPQVSSQKLALRIGIHQGMIRQRSKDVADNIPEIAAQLARIDDGILISEEVFSGLGKELSQFARPLEETGVGRKVFVVEWREMDLEAYVGKASSFSPQSLRKSPILELQLGVKVLELSEHKPVVTIGRDPASDLVITDVHASRYHCRIERTANEVLLTDSSTNGTIIVTESKQEILVKNGSATLQGKGMIFFGRPFMGERRGGIRYESS